MKKIIIINFKTFRKASGKQAIKLGKMAEIAARKRNVKIILAVQAADIYNVSKNVKIDVISQHVDIDNSGQHTGSILPENVKENGSKGSLLNHAEKTISLVAIKKAIARCKKLGMYNVVCVPSVKQALIIARFKPRYIAYEVPSLIGTGKAISKVKPRDVSIFAKAMEKRGIIPLCGAGISNGEDVRTAINLGCNGVLLASAVANANNPGKVLRDLVK